MTSAHTTAELIGNLRNGPGATVLTVRAADRIAELHALVARASREIDEAGGWSGSGEIQDRLRREAAGPHDVWKLGRVAAGPEHILMAVLLEAAHEDVHAGRAARKIWSLQDLIEQAADELEASGGYQGDDDLYRALRRQCLNGPIPDPDAWHGPSPG